MERRNFLAPIEVMAPKFQAVHKIVNGIRGTFDRKLLNFYFLSRVRYDEELIIFVLYHPGLFDIDSLISHIAILLNKVIFPGITGRLIDC